ncbi:MAG: hypothetical protein K8R85_00405, partial [Bacteroidetes bacterium]|nr:hypothetical protein [Bacteroidota bacterium]
VRQDSTLFDFWVGEWDLTWKDPDGSTAYGKNSVTKILDGKVITENFAGLTGQSKGYKGQSISILDNRTGTWKQTWVDNQNAYLPFTGGADGANRFFEQEFLKNGKLQKGKMIFRDITKEKFAWDWMSSADSGKTWNIQWSIQYSRKK